MLWVLCSGYVMPRLDRTPKSPEPVWHSRQSIVVVGRVSNLALAEPCPADAWWLIRLVTRDTAIDFTYLVFIEEGTTFVYVALDTGLLVGMRLVEHLGCL